MAHITVYLSNDIENRVRNAAKRQKVTLNKWITEQITKAVKDKLPESFLQAAGAYGLLVGLEFEPVDQRPMRTLIRVQCV